jgi:hypothetical protein
VRLTLAFSSNLSAVTKSTGRCTWTLFFWAFSRRCLTILAPSSSYNELPIYETKEKWNVAVNKTFSSTVKIDGSNKNQQKKNMVGNIAKTGNQDDAGHALQDLSIEKACEEYNNSVKLTLTLINHQLDAALAKHYNELEELAVKIAARTNFLEKNPSFLSCLVYNKTDVKSEPLLEFDEIKITLKDHSRRILDKVEEVDRYHRKLFELVVKGGREQKLLEGGREQKLLEGGRDLKLPESDRDLGLVQEVHRIREDDDEFQDCLEPKEEGGNEDLVREEEFPAEKANLAEGFLRQDHRAEGRLLRHQCGQHPRRAPHQIPAFSRHSDVPGRAETQTPGRHPREADPTTRGHRQSRGFHQADGATTAD